MSFEYGESLAKENPHKNDRVRAGSALAKAIAKVSCSLLIMHKTLDQFACENSSGICASELQNLQD